MCKYPTHQEETHRPPNRFRCLFPDLYLIDKYTCTHLKKSITGILSRHFASQRSSLQRRKHQCSVSHAFRKGNPSVAGRFPSQFYSHVESVSASWRHHMMTSSNGNIFRVTGPLCGEFTGPGEFPTQRPVTRSFDVFFDLRLNKRLSKQPWGWWFEMPSWSLWRQCDDFSSKNSFALGKKTEPSPRT